MSQKNWADYSTDSDSEEENVNNNCSDSEEENVKNNKDDMIHRLDNLLKSSV